MGSFKISENVQKKEDGPNSNFLPTSKWKGRNQSLRREQFHCHTWRNLLVLIYKFGVFLLEARISLFTFLEHYLTVKCMNRSVHDQYDSSSDQSHQSQKCGGFIYVQYI